MKSGFLSRLFNVPIVRGVLIGLLAGILALWVAQHPFLQALDLWVTDSSFLLRSTRESNCPITIVGIDEESLVDPELKRKPLRYLSREIAEIVEYLLEQKVAAIGIDVFLPEDYNDIEEFQGGAIGDAESLGVVIAESTNVVIPFLVTDEKVFRPIVHWTAPREFRAMFENLDSDPRDYGFVNLTTDKDQIIRRHIPFAAIDDGPRETQPQYGSLSACVAAHGLGVPLDQLQAQLPHEPDGAFLINFVGPPGSLPQTGFQRVLQEARGELPPTQSWEGRLVLIGATAPTLRDFHETPFSNASVISELGFSTLLSSSSHRMSGTEVHANIVATLYDGEYLLSAAPPFVAWLTILTGMVLGAMMVHYGLEVSVLLIMAHLVLTRVLAFVAFTSAQLVLPVSSLLVCGIITFALTFSLRWRFVRRTMGMFKSEAVARVIEADPSRLGLVAESCNVTILFADVRGFTTFSDRHQPQEAFRLLNSYFEQVVPTIEDNRGILNQYLGDGLMAIFGSPLPCTDHAFRAVLAALEMVNRVRSRQSVWKSMDAPEFRIGIGICTGDVVVGTIGSRRRLDFTAIGDTVNTAARIESATKEHECEILISGSTCESLSPQQIEQLPCRLVGPLKHAVRGKSEFVDVFKVVLDASQKHFSPEQDEES